MALDPQQDASTPGRSLYVEINSPDVRLGSAIRHITRPADSIRPAKLTGFPASSNVRKFTGLAWGMRPSLTDFTNAIVGAGLSPQWLVEGSMLDIAGLNVPFGDNTVVQHFAWKSPGDLPGVTPASEVIVRGMPVWRRVVPAGQSFDAELDADPSIFGKPTLPSQHVAMDRLLIGRQTYPPNAGWMIGFYYPPILASAMDTLLTFYFGGPNDISGAIPQEQGCWALSVRGSGECILFEKRANHWDQRDAFHWSNEPRPRGGWNFIEILPYGPDRIVFRSSAIASDITEGGRYFAASTFRRQQSEYLAHLYEHHEEDCGHRHLKSICGAGNIRFDARRDWRFEMCCGVQVYPETSDLYDEPFEIPTAPGGTKLRVSRRGIIPPGTDIQVTLYDAESHTPLSEGTDENGPHFLSSAGVRHYYAKIHFTSDADHLRAPLLIDYTITVDGFLTLSEAEPKNITQIRDCMLTGVDYKNPEYEQGVVTIEDLNYENEVSILRSRARIPARIITECLWRFNEEGGPLALSSTEGELQPTTSVLLDGEIASAPAEPFPKADDQVWPTSNARRYNLTVYGKWTRIWDQRLRSEFPLYNAQDGSLESVSTLIEKLFYLAGFTDNFLDIPEVSFQRPLSGKREQDILQSGIPIGEAILDLAGKYTDLLLFWDENAKKDTDEVMDGMWRGVYYPEPPFNVVWEFTRFGPEDPGRLPHRPESYPANTTFIESYREWIIPPEINSLELIGGTDGSDRSLVFRKRNRRSYRPTEDDPEPDPNHPDYIGHEVHVKIRLSELQDPNHVMVVGRRLFRDTAYGYPAAAFDAPLVLIWDLNDPYQIRPRKLRAGDMIKIDGRAAMVTSCNPKIPEHRGDLHQQAVYEVVYRDSFVGPPHWLYDDVEEE